jgi:hypothetical protein
MPESEVQIAISDRAGYGGVRNEWLDHLGGTQAIKGAEDYGFNIENK